MKILKLGMALLIGISTFSYANDTKAKTVIIFDASNSMWGQINGKRKIDTAKASLKKLVKEWNPSIQGELGITVYGHRKKKDCRDIETLVPLGNLNDKDAIYSKINKVQPKGKTPISLSLEKVAAELKKSEGITTIILISDGKDSCNADPCETVKRLKKEGLNFVSHVLGFDVKGDAKKQLQCIAKEGGGIITIADKPEEVAKAMKEIEEKMKSTIKANNDDFSKNIINSKVGGNAGNVILNDKYNEMLADSAMINIKFEDQKNINIDLKGDLLVNKGIPVGKHTVKYTICEKTRTDNCSSAQVSLVVKDITNTNIISQDSGTQVTASYQFFTMNKSGEADENLQRQCTSSESEPCMLDLKKGEYLILSTSGDKKGEALISITKDLALTEGDIQKIIVNLK